MATAMRRRPLELEEDAAIRTMDLPVRAIRVAVVLALDVREVEVVARRDPERLAEDERHAAIELGGVGVEATIDPVVVPVPAALGPVEAADAGAAEDLDRHVARVD